MGCTNYHDALYGAGSYDHTWYSVDESTPAVYVNTGACEVRLEMSGWWGLLVNSSSHTLQAGARWTPGSIKHGFWGDGDHRLVVTPSQDGTNMDVTFDAKDC